MNEKKMYYAPCVEVIELIAASKILDGSPTENINPGGEHDWDNS